MIRRDFFMILTDVKNCEDSISYVKKYSKNTSLVSLKAVQEIKDLFDYETTQKITMLLMFIVTFLLGAISYFIDVGADYSLLFKSSHCPGTNRTRHLANSTSMCFNQSQSHFRTECYSWNPITGFSDSCATDEFKALPTVCVYSATP